MKSFVFDWESSLFFLRILLGIFLVQTPYAIATDQGLEFWYTRELPAADALAIKAPFHMKDLVLVGDTVTINEEIKTNGGNVLILADRLIVNAPIDTRVYSIPTRIWEQGSPLVLGDFAYAHEAITPFVNFYLWHDYYDPTSHSYKYRAGSLTELQEGKLALPTMPSGLIPTAHVALPPWEGAPQDGPTAPSGYDRDTFKSGNITIYARVIEFCDACIRRRLKGQPVPEGDPGDNENMRFFNVAGLKGGRGGLGSIFPCPYRAQYHISPTLICDQHGVPDRSGGLSGNPGRGGDAGNVSIFIINNPDFVWEQNASGFELAGSSDELNEKLGRSIAALTDIKGGRPSSMTQLRTPSFNILASSQSRKLFASEGQSLPPDAFYGANGNLIIDNISAEIALEQFAAAVTVIDSNPKYDLQALLNHQLKLRPTASPLARDWLAIFLSSMLLKRQIWLLETTPRMIDEGSAQDFPKDFFFDLHCGHVSIGNLSDLELEIIRRICDFRPSLPPQDALRSYLVQTGGLFQPSIVAAPNLQLQQLTAEVLRLNVTAQQLVSELQQLKSMFYNFVTDQIKIRYETRIKELQISLKKAIAALEAQKDWLSQAVAIGTNAQNHLQNAAAEWAKPAPNFFAVAGSSGALIDNMTTLFKLMDSVYRGTFTSEQEIAVKKIQAELSSVRQEFGKFLKETTEMKKELLERQLQSLRAYLDAKNRVETSRRLFMFDFKNYLREALLLYAEDPSQQHVDFVTALRSLKDALNHFPDQSLPLLPKLRYIGCERQPAPPLASIEPNTPVACASVTAEGANYSLVSIPSSRLPNFPLLLVNAGSGNFMANFHRVFTPAEINKVVPSIYEKADDRPYVLFPFEVCAGHESNCVGLPATPNHCTFREVSNLPSGKKVVKVDPNYEQGQVFSGPPKFILKIAPHPNSTTNPLTVRDIHICGASPPNETWRQQIKVKVYYE
jgi:hypothetical protein